MFLQKKKKKSNSNEHQERFLIFKKAFLPFFRIIKTYEGGKFLQF